MRRQLSAIPPYYTSSSYYRPKVNGAMEALEAFNLASINVVSFAMVGVGAFMYMANVNSLDDMRKLVRGGLGVDGTGRSEQEVEEEFEEWVIGVLGRKTEKEIQFEKERETKKGILEQVEEQKRRVNERGKER